MNKERQSNAVNRKYPVGIQSFESLRKDGYAYVDKTHLIYKMITEGKPYFLSRPRRFGKSLLCSTIEAIFDGRKELFEAFTTEEGIEQPQLFIAKTTWNWDKYPVIHFDFSKDLSTIDELDEQIDKDLYEYEEKFCVKRKAKGLSYRISDLIIGAHVMTGRRVVFIVDEYDKFLLHAIGNRKQEEQIKMRFKQLLSPLKSLDEHLQLVFITGISKFSQMGVFSTINQLMNISMAGDYEEICGISDNELTTVFRKDIEMLAKKRGETYEEAYNALKTAYDGYHFSARLTDMYNPFSLVNAFHFGEISNYWFESATPSALIDMMAQMRPFGLEDIDGVKCRESAFYQPFSSFEDPMPPLWQSGYLTIKDYRRDRDIYTIGFPNEEVRKGFAECLLQYIANIRPSDRCSSMLLNAYYDFCDDDNLAHFIEAVKVFYAGVPYQWEKDNRNEHYYHALFYTMLTSFGADVRVGQTSAMGVSDLTLYMPHGIYVMEMKYDRTAEEALEQIDKKGYAESLLLDGRPVTKVGIAFSSKERNITEWIAEAATPVR